MFIPSVGRVDLEELWEILKKTSRVNPWSVRAWRINVCLFLRCRNSSEYKCNSNFLGFIQVFSSFLSCCPVTSRRFGLICITYCSLCKLAEIFLETWGIMIVAIANTASAETVEGIQELSSFKGCLHEAVMLGVWKWVWT